MTTDKDTRAEFIATQKENALADYSIRMRGLLHKGYCGDLMEINHVFHTADMARDGLFHMLPDGLFFYEDYLRDARNDDERKDRAALLKEQKANYAVYFEPFDTLLFRQSISLQQKIDKAEENQQVLLLKTFYGIDLTRVRNPLVKQLAYLWLESDVVKGDISLLAFCVKKILGEQTSCRVTSMVPVDLPEGANAMAYNHVQFTIFIKGLTASEYKEKMSQYEEFFAFLRQWFLPYDCEMDYCIKDTHQPFILGEQLTLDYNTQI